MSANDIVNALQQVRKDLLDATPAGEDLADIMDGLAAVYESDRLLRTRLLRVIIRRS
jgi:hypothetical protein